MARLTVTELRPFPGKPRRFRISKVLFKGGPSNKHSELFRLSVGSVLYLSELRKITTSGVDVVLTGGDK